MVGPGGAARAARGRAQVSDAGVVTVSCPSCRRPNASHRPTCLYCGRAMPAPTAPPPPAAPRELPADLDALVRNALQRGDASKLKAALSGGRGPEERPTSPTEAPSFAREGRATSPGERRTAPGFGPRAGERPTEPGWERRSSATDYGLPRPIGAPSAWGAPGADAGPIAPAPPAALPPVDPRAAAMSALSRWSGRAEADLARGDPEGVRQALAELRAALERAEASIADMPASAPPPAPAPEAPAWALPRHRQPYLLVVDGLADANRGPAVAAALSVDGVTARLVAVSRHPRVALRGDDPAVLATAAHRLRTEVGVAAVVLGRAQLQEVEAPAAVLAGSPQRRVLCSAAPAWLLPPEPGLALRLRPDALSLGAEDVRLAVPGEVVVRSYRAGRGLAHGRRDETVLRVAGERRLQLVDLHGPGLFLRVVEGITDLAGLPGFDPQSALRSMKGFIEGLGQLWPAARVDGARTCLPTDAPTAEEGQQRGDHIEISGWADWEEHSRCCRFLSGLRPEGLLHLAAARA
jgi:hypothetical protein